VNLVKLAEIAISPVLGKGLVSSSASAGPGCCGKLTRQVSLDNQATSRQKTPSQLTVTALASAQGLKAIKSGCSVDFQSKKIDTERSNYFGPIPRT
jgi:hypothetical protein